MLARIFFQLSIATFLSNFILFSLILSPSLSLQPVSVFRPLAPVGRCLSLSPTSGQAAGAGRGSALGVGVAARSMRVGEAIRCKAQGTVKKGANSRVKKKYLTYAKQCAAKRAQKVKPNLSSLSQSIYQSVY